MQFLFFYMPYLFLILFLGPGPENTEVDQVSGPVKVAMVPAKKRGRRISSEQNASSSSLVQFIYISYVPFRSFIFFYIASLPIKRSLEVRSPKRSQKRSLRRKLRSRHLNLLVILTKLLMIQVIPITRKNQSLVKQRKILEMEVTFGRMKRRMTHQLLSFQMINGLKSLKLRIFLSGQHEMVT